MLLFYKTVKSATKLNITITWTTVREREHATRFPIRLECLEPSCNKFTGK